MAAPHFPTESSLKRDLDAKTAPILKRGDKLISDRWNMSQAEFLRKAAEHQEDSKEVQRLSGEYISNVANIGSLQLIIIRQALELWLCFGGIIIAIGLAGRWIVRGFRPKNHDRNIT